MPVQFKKSAKARKNGTTLVAAFPKANPPLIWKFDLEKNHSFTVTLHEKDGDWELGVTTPRDEFHIIARFLEQEDAEEAFVCTQKALMVRPCGRAWSIWGRISLVIFCIALGWMLLSFLMHSDASKTDTLSGPAALSGAPHEVKEGVPVPADQVLQPPP